MKRVGTLSQRYAIIAVIARAIGFLVVVVVVLAASTVSAVRPFLAPAEADVRPVQDGAVNGPWPGLTVYVNTPALNLRAAPGTDQAVLAVLPAGTRVTTHGHGQRIGDRMWIDVHVPTLGIDGWVAKRYLAVVPTSRPPR